MTLSAREIETIKKLEEDGVKHHIASINRDYVRNITRAITNVYQKQRDTISRIENAAVEEIDKEAAKIRLEVINEFISELESGNATSL